MKIAATLVYLSISLFFAGCGGGGGGDAAPAPEPTPSPTPSPTPQPGSGSKYGPAVSFDRDASYWTIANSTSSLTGEKTTNISVNSTDSTFVISCDGSKRVSYFIRTDYVTGSGSIRYRVGSNPVVAQSWSESQPSGFRLLSPPGTDPELIKSFYKNWDLVFEIPKFGAGVRTTAFSISGFSAVVDKTRSECNWSTIDFPPGNGWGKEYPIYPPEDAREAVYTPGANQQFRLVAWRATNAAGKPQILARLGDEGGPCVGGFLVTDALLYVTQNGKRVPALSGSRLRQPCKQPIIVALNGDFSASEPLALSAHEFHYSNLDIGAVAASISFN